MNKPISIEVLRQTEDLIETGHSRGKIEESLSQMGYDMVQIDQIFKTIEEKKLRGKNRKQKIQLAVLIITLGLFFALMAAIAIFFELT